MAGSHNARGGVGSRVEGSQRASTAWGREGETGPLANMTVSREVARKGLRIWQEGRVRGVGLVPNVFHVEGDGDDFYTVDLLDPVSCDCAFFTHRQKACKHMLAAVFQSHYPSMSLSERKEMSL